MAPDSSGSHVRQVTAILKGYKSHGGRDIPAKGSKKVTWKGLSSQPAKENENVVDGADGTGPPKVNLLSSTIRNLF